MLRGMVAGFKKEREVTTYSRFSAYNIESVRRQTYESQEQVDVMMVEGQKQTIAKGSTTISEKYLAGGEGYDMGGTYGSGQVLVVFQTNANTDLLAYVIKSREELGDDYYTYMDAFYSGMTDTIWNTMQSRFATTLTVSTSSGTITISDGSQSVLVNASNHNMRYNNNYYAETSDASSEYSTMSANGWLIDGTYGPYDISSQEGTDWTNVINSLKTKGIVNATITHNAQSGEIIIENGSYNIVIADKDLGASQPNSDGYYYQRGNNYGFTLGAISDKSSTTVDASAYGPGNYYSSSTWIEDQMWDSSDNTNLWGGVSGTELAMQGPCASGWHIPSKTERENLLSFFNAVRPNAHSAEDFRTAFKLQNAAMLNYKAQKTNTGYSFYISSTASQSFCDILHINRGNYPEVEAGHKGSGRPIRPFKNTYTLIPINQLWSTFGDTTDVQNEMNSHPYDYYLLGGCQSSLRLYSEGSMYAVWAEYNTNTSTRRVEEAV